MHITSHASLCHWWLEAKFHDVLCTQQMCLGSVERTTNACYITTDVFMKVEFG